MLSSAGQRETLDIAANVGRETRGRFSNPASSGVIYFFFPLWSETEASARAH